MSKQSRQKRKRSTLRGAETEGSRLFRQHLFVESVTEDSLAAMRRSGLAVEAIDPVVLAKLARPFGVVKIDGVFVSVIEPIGEWVSGKDFDHAMARAGMLRFIRPSMMGDEAGTDADGVVRIGGTVS